MKTREDTTLYDNGPGNRYLRFQDLMKFRVRDILLVSSQYDSFILSEDGSFYDH